MDSKERIEHLRRYIIGCIQSNLLTMEDLTTGYVFHKLVAVIAKDSKLVFSDLLRDSIAGAARMGVMKLAQFAENISKKRR